MRSALQKLLARWRPYGELIRRLFAAGPWLTVTLLATILLRSLAPVGFVVAAATVVSKVPATVHGGLGSHSGHILLIGLALMALAFFIQQLIPPATDQLAYTLGNRLHLQLEQRLMQAVLTPPSIGHLEEAETLTNETFDSLEAAEWEVFRLRWEALAGTPLVLED